MIEKKYNWKRFWLPQSDNINLTEEGYFYNPDNDWGQIHNPNATILESLIKIPCLILLGEPGIGKTYSLMNNKQRIYEIINKEGGDVLWLNLRSYSSEERLIKDIFEDYKFLTSIKNKSKLHIFLDSLDECLIQIKTLSSILIDEFKKYLIDNIYLCIVCRTVDWPNDLEMDLKTIWNNENLKIFEMAPLRREDIEETALKNNIDPKIFLTEIEKKEIVPFAIKPITLKFLILTYLKYDDFPKTKYDLYLKGCSLLCDEIDDARRRKKLTGEYDARQKLEVAARIAAVSIFTNRPFIWKGINFGDITDEDISIEELSGGYEKANDEKFNINEKIINETLQTGLFIIQNANRVSWSHQTYAEFLAAYYIERHNMKTKQILSIITHQEDPDNRIVPQLYNTSAWLASIIPDIFKFIIIKNPELLLRSDLSNVEPDDKKSLIDYILKLQSENKLLISSLLFHRMCGKLNYPGIENQLKHYIFDKSKDTSVRQLAIDITEGCNIKSYQNDLVQLALDSTENFQVRTYATDAVCHIADDNIKAKLKPLAYIDNSEDKDDDLKGYGLRAIWPKHISTKEMLSLITPPIQDNLIGSYFHFLQNDLKKYLTEKDIPIILEWIVSHKSLSDSSFIIKRLFDDLIIRALQYLDNIKVKKGLAKVIVSRIRQYDQVINNDKVQLFNIEITRNKVTTQLLEAINISGVPFSDD